MKQILLNVSSKEACDILEHKKTIIISRSFPLTQEEESEVFLYCTQHKPKVMIYDIDDNCNILNGKIFAKFKYRKTYFINPEDLKHYDDDENIFLKSGTRLSKEEIIKYSNGNQIFGLVIEDLEVFKFSKDLKEFNRKRPPKNWCYLK